MTAAIKRGLSLWVIVLVVGLLWISPATDGRTVLSIGLAAGLLILGGHWLDRRTAPVGSGLLRQLALPGAGYRRPLVLVCSPGRPAEHREGLSVRQTARGCLIAVGDPGQLPAVVGALLEQRPHWAEQLAVVLLVEPQRCTDAPALAGGLRAFRHQLGQARRQGAEMPLLVASLLPAADRHLGWCTWEAEQAAPRWRDGTSSNSLAYWQRENSLDTTARVQASVGFEAMGQWLEHAVLDPLIAADGRLPACPPLACAVHQTDMSDGQAGNLWQAWLRQRTRLQRLSAGAAADAATPCLDPLLDVLPQGQGMRPLHRLWLPGLWLTVLAVLAALFMSAWHNQRLLLQVAQDIRAYQAIPPPLHRDDPRHLARERLIQQLAEQHRQSQQHQRHGPPWHLGWGLYGGRAMQVPIQAVLDRHRPPALDPADTAPLRLDSLTLFAPGSAALKAEASKVLINALAGIKARPGWLVVIAGHTDNTGDAALNRPLSLARAAAVRDWMQHMGDLPDSCFAIQGHGASQPLAANDTAEGRAANRRVDIRLMRQAQACLSERAAGVQPPPSASTAITVDQ